MFEKKVESVGVVVEEGGSHKSRIFYKILKPIMFSKHLYSAN